MRDPIAKISTPLSSSRVIISLALPMLVWISVLVYGRGLLLSSAVGALPFRIYWFALLLFMLVAIARYLSARSYPAVLVHFGILLLMLQGMLWFGFRFSGKTGIGVGESVGGYYSVESGPWASPPELPVSLVTVITGTDKAPMALLSIDGQERELVPDQTLSWKDHRIRISAISRAPLFLLRDGKGVELEAGYIKLPFHDPGPHSFQFSTVPHRFYVSLRAEDGESWNNADGAWKRTAPRVPDAGVPTDPETLQVRVMRGKLTLASRGIKRGEPVAFDGFTIAFEPGSPWVEFVITKVHSFKLLYVAAALIMAGFLAQVFVRRST